jgi:hypothetical protein
VISVVTTEDCFEETSVLFFGALLIWRTDGIIAKLLIIAITKYVNLILSMKSVISDGVTEIVPIPETILLISA